MSKEQFVTDYLAPFVMALDETITDIRYVNRLGHYELVNLSYKAGFPVSIVVTGKSRRGIAGAVIRYILKTETE